MKMKKLGSLMMVGVLVGTMLVGCGKGSSSETKDAKYCICSSDCHR